jgi:thiosulfate/3-mercaptopyruvate sulfurtransferase
VQVDLSKVAQYKIEYDELKQQVDSNNIQLWDCRTTDEYTGLRLAARRGGHIPAALHFEWSTALDRQNHLKLHPLERTQARLQQLGFQFDQPVVVYCQSHHRSGLAYIIGRLLQWQFVLMMGRGVNGAIASIVQLLLERIRFEFYITIKKDLFIKAQSLVPQHQLSRVVGKVAASENVVVRTAVIQPLKRNMALIFRLLNRRCLKIQIL